MPKSNNVLCVRVRSSHSYVWEFVIAVVTIIIIQRNISKDLRNMDEDLCDSK